MGHERDSGMESTKSHSCPPVRRGAHAQHSAIVAAIYFCVIRCSLGGKYRKTCSTIAYTLQIHVYKTFIRIMQANMLVNNYNVTWQRKY